MISSYMPNHMGEVDWEGAYLDRKDEAAGSATHPGNKSVPDGGAVTIKLGMN